MPCDPARAVEPMPPDTTWLLRHKVELPDPIEGYVRRPDVEGRCELTDWCLAVVQAPGGFGQAALLACCCRGLRDRGLAVAWLSLDEDDGPGSVATCGPWPLSGPACRRSTRLVRGL